MTKPRLLLLLLTIVCCLTGWSVNGAVTLTQSGNACTIRNDFVSVYISKDGEITSLLKSHHCSNTRITTETLIILYS